MKTCWFAAALVWLGADFLRAAEPSGILIGRVAEGSPYERLMSVPVLYQNEDNPWIQQLAVVGQLQLQYGYGSDASGNYGSADFPDASRWGDLEVRRFRLGMKGRLFKKLFFLNLTELNADLEPRIYKRTPETYLTWMENDAFNISAGKSELKFNREQEYSSRDFPAFERTALGNMLYGGELTGAWICGKGSRDENGVILPTRYEALSPGAGDKRGDEYVASYAGLNYYIDGHRLKLMSGAKYNHMDGESGGGDFNGWTWLAGLRMAF